MLVCCRDAIACKNTHNFSPTKSPYWNRMTEYINAEVTGKKHGDCRKFEKDCAKSLYKLNKYS